MVVTVCVEVGSLPLRDVVVSEARVIMRVLGVSDGLAAVVVINTTAKWYAEVLAPSEVDEPEMTLERWTEEARQITWHGASDGVDLVGVIDLEYGSAGSDRPRICRRRCPTVSDKVSQSYRSRLGPIRIGQPQRGELDGSRPSPLPGRRDSLDNER